MLVTELLRSSIIHLNFASDPCTKYSVPLYGDFTSNQLFWITVIFITKYLYNKYSLYYYYLFLSLHEHVGAKTSRAIWRQDENFIVL